MAGLDPAALAVLHAAAGAAADAAAAMAAARARFAAHYSQVRAFAANGGVLPLDGRWITGDGDAPAQHSGAPAPGTEPATPAVQAVTIRDTAADRAGAGKADPVSAADGLLGTGPAARRATRVTRQVINLAFEAGLNPSLDPSGVRHGSYRIMIDSGGRRDCLFGGIDVGARTGRILHAHLTHGSWGQERRYDHVAGIHAVLTSWAALQRDRRDCADRAHEHGVSP